MKELKFKSVSDVAHSFAKVTTKGCGTNYSGNIFYINDTIYSYGEHHIIAKKIRDKSNNVVFTLVNNNVYSSTTSKHTSIVQMALYSKVIGVFTDIKYFMPVNEIKEKALKAVYLYERYKGARTEGRIKYHFRDLLTIIKEIQLLTTYYKVKSKLPKFVKSFVNLDFNNQDKFLPGLDRLAKTVQRFKKREKIKEFQVFENNKKRRNKDLQMALTSWRNFKTNHIYDSIDNRSYLRYNSKTGEIETTQNITIKVEEFNRLWKYYKNKTLVGKTVKCNFPTEINSMKFSVIVGCHDIPFKEIEDIKKCLEKV